MKKTNKHALINLCILTLFGVFLSSCISLKSEYPEIKYYKLDQYATAIDRIQPIESALLIRTFTAPNHIDGDRIIAYNSESIAQRYFYHRWAAEAPDLVTDFFIERYNKLSAFSNGVIRTSASQIADYILEADILEMHAFNDNYKNDSSYSKFTLRVSLIKRNFDKVEQSLLLQKVYSSIKVREKANIATIVPSINMAINEVADHVLVDIMSAIQNEK